MGESKERRRMLKGKGNSITTFPSSSSAAYTANKKFFSSRESLRHQWWKLLYISIRPLGSKVNEGHGRFQSNVMVGREWLPFNYHICIFKRPISLQLFRFQLLMVLLFFCHPHLPLLNANFFIITSSSAPQWIVS